MYSISNLDSVAFLQGSASKSIHDIGNTSLCRGLKKKAGLRYWIQDCNKGTQPSLRSCSVYLEMLNRTLKQFVSTSAMLFLCLVLSGPFNLELQRGVLHLVLLPVL